jgi:hypothetical protein
MVHGTFSRCLVLNLFKMFSNKIVWTMDSETVSRRSGSIFHIVILSVTKFLSGLSTKSPVRKYLFIASRSRVRNRLMTNRNLSHSFWGSCLWINAFSDSITFRDLQVNRCCGTNVPFQHERTGMTKLQHQCPCSPFQEIARLQNTRRLYVGETWHFCKSCILPRVLALRSYPINKSGLW